MILLYILYHLIVNYVKFNKKELKAVKRRIENRDSFDRFCDDLSEVLLTYLSIEQRVKFECVSKQWQRNVFKTQYKLHLNYLTDWLQNSDNYLPPIESVFEKCSLINHISCDFANIAEEFGKFMPRKVLRKIADNCVNLRSIHFGSYKLRTHNLRNVAKTIPYEDCLHFFETRGQNLRCVVYDEDMPAYHYRLILNFCPNLRSLHCPHIDLDGRTPYRKQYVLVTKLEQIGTIGVCDDNDKVLFDVFMSQCAKTIKSLRIKFSRNGDNDRIFEQISNLINLEKLDFKFFSDFDIFTCVDGFKQIAAKCRKLLHLHLQVFGFTAESVKTLNNCLKYFTQITNFQLAIQMNREIDYLIPQSLMYCKRLTNICLDIPITDTTFNNLHSILPQLKVIRLERVFNKIITDFTFKCLAKLKQLNVLDLSSCNAELTAITDEGMCDILENCLQFRSFNLKSLPNITLKTIDKLIEVAINRPHIGFIHKFMCLSNYLEMPLFKIIIERESYPKNLQIIIILITYDYDSLSLKYVQVFNSRSLPYI